jgi:branched-chain amino acid transport system permease protein
VNAAGVAPRRFSIPDRSLAFKLVGAIAACLFLVNFATSASEYQLFLANTTLIAILAAISLNVLIGNAGQVSIGHAAFFGLGAAVTAIADNKLGVPAVGAFGLAVLVSIGVGLVVGLPSLRLRGFYLAIATFAFHEIFISLFDRYQSSDVGQIGFRINSAPRWQGLTWFIVLGCVVLVVIAITWSLISSKTGRAWSALRADEDLALSMGISVTRYKLAAFCYSAAVVGAAGSLQAFFLRRVSSEYYTLDLAIIYLVMIVVGGLASIRGAIVGAILIHNLSELINKGYTFLPQSYPGSVWTKAHLFELETAVYGALLLVFLIMAPDGLVGLVKSLRRWVRRMLSKHRRSRISDGSYALESPTESEGPDTFTETSNE